MVEILKIVFTVLACYFLGNIHAALVISKIIKRDIRKVGTGNLGAMNMTRNFGFKLGATALFFDALKGIIAALFGWFMLGKSQPINSFSDWFSSNNSQSFAFSSDRIGMYIGAAAVIIGHIYPVFLKFKGGKGIASTIGVCLVINPIVTLISFVAGFTFISITKMGSIGSFIVITPPLAFTAYKLATTAPSPNHIVCPLILLLIFFLALFAHRKNIVRLFTGTDNKTRIFKKKNR